MLDHKEAAHEYYEELSALANLGEVSFQELAELESHLASCEPCRRENAGFIEILHKRLPLVHAAPENLKMYLLSFFKRSGYRKRFLFGAREQGIHFSKDAEQDRVVEGNWGSAWLIRPVQQAVVVSLVLTMIGIAVLGDKWHQSAAQQSVLSGQISKLNEENNGLRKEIQGFSSVEHLARADWDLHQKEDSLSKELIQTRSEYSSALAHARDLDAQLRASAMQIQSLKDEIQTRKNSSGELESKLKDAELAYGLVNNELQALRDTRKSESAALANQAMRFRDLTELVQSQSETIDRDRKLLAAGRDIRDLMGARKLHIIDVFDVDGRGKTGQAFGRVFYTEGRSLIFYAYDLSQKKVSLSKASFQAWGFEEPSERSAQSLGIFYVDDQSQNRWVLRYEDPNVLEHINAVFVTLEPRGGSSKPTGHKLLYAFLSNRPNHP